MAFSLHTTLAADTHSVTRLGLCELLLMDDARWPWLILVPRRVGAREIHGLQPLDQVMLAHEQSLVAESLAGLTGCRSINVAALGNVVEQLHVHVVARDEDDPNWPGPIWGHGTRQPYTPDARRAMIGAVAAVL